MNTHDKSFDDGKQALRDIKNTLKAGAADVAGEARGAAGDLSDAAESSGDAATGAMRSISDHASAAAAATKVAVGDAVESAKVAVGNAIQYQSEKLSDLRVHTEGYVRKQPIAAIALAAGVGTIIGFLLRGSRE